MLETLVMIGGYGFKTAVEVVLMATDYGTVLPFIEAIAVAGTLNKGADTAIVVKTTYRRTCFPAILINECKFSRFSPCLGIRNGIGIWVSGNLKLKKLKKEKL